MSMRGERSGSALRRYRSAISTSPSHESERATIRGTVVRARGGGPDLVFRLPVFEGFAVSIWDSDVDGSGETFRILRGRRGIFEGGGFGWRGTTFLRSDSAGVPSEMVVDAAAEEGVGCGWGSIRDWAWPSVCSPISERDVIED